MACPWGSAASVLIDVFRRGGLSINRGASRVTFILQDVNVIGPGEICATFGVECSSGDTFTGGSTSFSMVRITMPLYSNILK